MHSTKYILAALFCSMMTIVHAEDPNQTHTRSNPTGLGIDGYSPVSYFEHNQAEIGSPEYAYSVDGITYHLTSQQQLDKFKANPQAYLPAHGGWCSLMLSGSGQLTPANPESFKIIDGQLLLFWDGSFKGQAVNGLSNWHSKTGRDPKKASKRLKQANQTWNKIQSGKKSIKLVIFDEADKQRLSEKWLAMAKQKY